MIRIFLILFLSLMNFMIAQDIQPILQSKKPQRTDLKIVIDKDNENHYLPISIIRGKEKGKTITIVAGIHGYEYPPIMAVQEILTEIKPEKLKGNIIILPIANMSGFQKRVPFLHPTDHKNLNTVFPGAENGSVSEKIAHYITKNIIPISDVFIDIHGGDAGEDLIPFVCHYDDQSNPKNTLTAHELSIKSEIPIIVSYPYTISKTEPALYAFKQAVQDGVVALSLEAGKLGANDPDDIKMLKQGVYNILGHLGMYKNPSPSQKMFKRKVYENQGYVKAPASGIFYSTKKAGDSVNKGEELGYITDEFGNIVQKITAPNSGLILYKTGTPPVNKGETMFCIVW